MKIKKTIVNNRRNNILKFIKDNKQEITKKKSQKNVPIL